MQHLSDETDTWLNRWSVHNQGEGTCVTKASYIMDFNAERQAPSSAFISASCLLRVPRGGCGMRIAQLRMKKSYMHSYTSPRYGLSTYKRRSNIVLRTHASTFAARSITSCKIRFDHDLLLSNSMARTCRHDTEHISTHFPVCPGKASELREHVQRIHQRCACMCQHASPKNAS